MKLSQVVALLSLAALSLGATGHRTKPTVKPNRWDLEYVQSNVSNGIYQSSPTNPTSGVPFPFQLDSTGNLKVVTLGGGGTVVNPSIAGGEYLASPPTLSNTNTGPLLFDVNENLKQTMATAIEGEDFTNVVLGTANKITPSATYSPSAPDIGAAVITHTSKASAGNLLALDVFNGSATGEYFQIWDSLTAGTGTLVKTVWVPAITGSNPANVTRGVNDFTANGYYCATGITYGWSTTATTYSAVGAATSLLAQVSFK